MATRKKSPAQRKAAAIEAKRKKPRKRTSTQNTRAILDRNSEKADKRRARAQPTTGDGRDAAAVRRIRRTVGRRKK